MSEAPSPAELERFRAGVAERLGLWFDDGKLEFLSSVLERRRDARAEVTSRYLARVEAPGAEAEAELRELAQELTVGETYFFRHSDQFRAFAEVALPQRIEARSTVRQLRLLSAGSSSGEEGYSLAMLAQDALAGADFQLFVKGLDINPKAIERARLARYSAWALRETPEAIRKRNFTLEAREHVLAKSIRDSVTFEERNLLAEEWVAPELYDVVFCRNVLMYFTPEGAQRVVSQIARSLAPGGYLFLGHAENLRGLSQDFELCHTHRTFYYRRKQAIGAALNALDAPSLPSTARRSPAVAPVDWASTWLETVQKSSDRIRALTEKGQRDVSLPASRAAGSIDLSLALEHLAQERFSDALAVLYRLPESAARHADAVLLRAALLTHSGMLDAAERACGELLALDALNAGAHYLRALCRERNGDLRAAVEHAQIASYLDPTFAMPHLHLGLMARRSGERGAAERALSHAALLLQREEASRLLLFGGGFGREGLIALCRSELERLRENP